MSKKNKCKECNGVGYFKEVISYGSISIHDPYRKPHIERCDTCETFNNDEEVIQYLTNVERWTRQASEVTKQENERESKE